MKRFGTSGGDSDKNLCRGSCSFPFYGRTPATIGNSTALGTGRYLFVTCALRGGGSVLANPKFLKQSRRPWLNSKDGSVLAGVRLCLTTHICNHPRRIGIFRRYFSGRIKRLVERLGSQLWEWQRGCFDRLCGRTRICTTSGFTWNRSGSGD